MNQFGRRCDVVFVDAAGKGLDFSELRVKFHIRKADEQNPNTARITVYGVAQETVARVKKEFVEVVLQAGYAENFGLIFRGNIKNVRSGRENATDNYMEISAGDGDEDYVFGIVNKTLAAGASQNDVANAAMIGAPGYVPDLGGAKLPRAKVLYGSKRDLLRVCSVSTDTNWSIQDGKTQFVPVTGLLPTQAVELNSSTGLVGVPEQTVDGVKAECLLNPMLKIAGLVVINEKDVASAKFVEPKDPNKKEQELAKIAADGQYRLLKVEHVGDTRGQEWYSRLVCLSADASAPPNKKVKP